MLQQISISEYLSSKSDYLLFDVRSEAEYEHAHIPGAFSMPIFNNAERAEIGTTYKKVSREKAVQIGLKYFGSRLNDYIQNVQSLQKDPAHESKRIALHCWRGGMRSQAMAWLLSFYGYEISLVQGGYKSYRRKVLDDFQLPYQFQVLGGYTGSAKTEIIQELHRNHQACIDLEDLAKHKGSSFGALGMPTQPSQEQFENNLHEALMKYCNIQDHELQQSRKIWVENESMRIGLVNIPNSIFESMLRSDLMTLEIPFELRLNHILDYYGKFDLEDLKNAVLRIQKRLGGLETKKAIEFLDASDREACFRLLLTYYDRNYNKYSQYNNRKHQHIQLNQIDPIINAQKILEIFNHGSDH